MSEYIKREAARECFYKWLSDIFGIDKLELPVLNKRLNAIPAADVAPVVHGKWNIVKLPPDPGYKAKECSECRCDFWDLEEWDYCPNCGATMDGAE